MTPFVEKMYYKNVCNCNRLHGYKDLVSVCFDNLYCF